jgi:hypothetical protein
LLSGGVLPPNGNILTVALLYREEEVIVLWRKSDGREEWIIFLSSLSRAWCFSLFLERIWETVLAFFLFFYWLASPVNSPLFMRGTPTYLFIGKLISYYFFLIAWPQTIKKIILVFYFFLVYFWYPCPNIFVFLFLFLYFDALKKNDVNMNSKYWLIILKWVC